MSCPLELAIVFGLSCSHFAVWTSFYERKAFLLLGLSLALFRDALLVKTFWNGFALILEHLVKIDDDYSRGCRLMKSPGFVEMLL